MDKKTAIIIGAGPAGLTAAYELVNKTNIRPVIYEMSSDIGGISRTVNYKGNKIDIGGHRFFSKSDRIMKWWLNIFPLQGAPSIDDLKLSRKIPISQEKNAPNPEKEDRVMLFRQRLSRIFYLQKFFDYPISLNFNTIFKLGIWRILKIGLSYVRIRLKPIKEEKSLADFFINRFGKELYLTFFKDYTEKLWGISCEKISAEWGAQRVKGVSVSKALKHAVTNVFRKDKSIAQKGTETSLIDQFIYPKYGPGQMWEEVANVIKQKGGEIYLDHQVIQLRLNKDKITEAVIKDKNRNNIIRRKADYFFSTMPAKDLIYAFGEVVPKNIQSIAQGLSYRSSITVGLLLKKLKINNKTNIKTLNNIIPDTWIYIQEKAVKICRIQIYNNWSPYMLKDLSKAWIGLEYVCSQGGELWQMNDEKFARFAIDEVDSINIINKTDVLDKVVIRIENTYPAYFGTYNQFNQIRDFTDNISNLFLIGRNGMHRYNNQDHSMLTAMTAVDNIINGIAAKDNIWQVNAESDYHEEK